MLCEVYMIDQRVKASWIKEGKDQYRCNNCNDVTDYNYCICMNCGARMKWRIKHAEKRKL